MGLSNSQDLKTGLWIEKPPGLHPGLTFMARSPLYSCVPGRVAWGTLSAWEHAVGGAVSRKNAERSLVVHTPRSYKEKQRESCSKNTALSQAVWVAGCLLHLHLRLALLQRPRGMSEKRKFSGSIVSTCLPTYIDIRAYSS